MNSKYIIVLIRISISFSFISAVADRFGWWGVKNSVWGNWSNFLAYTQQINPWFPKSMISFIGLVATALEIALAICLLIGFKTKWAAIGSALLLFVFGISMTFALGIKSALDYSVFSAAAAALALSWLVENK